ncbi:type IX secretion/gliding motility protein PorT/SprT [Algoriphagus halophilus]|uniref:Probable protein-translocating porin PorT n=1 Tax=Algoriphagus halophilus TaxID=226505 RepID=A0A1N6FM37_9BACT|nr:porin family protein [Algoriphagus halophilus]SIN96325.1 probable protein-translocating porin PorT [Algoriphagus halophilus]
MQTTYIRHQLHLCGREISLTVFLMMVMTLSSFGQGMFGLTSGSGSDNKTLSYGFFLAAHTNAYQIKYSDAFMNPATTSSAGVRAVFPKYSPGFSLGFIGMLRFHDQVQLLFTPKVGFYEYKTEVSYFGTADSSLDNFPADEGNTLNNTTSTQMLTSEATMVELPLLFKYRSQRFNNTRMYFLGGASYNFRTKAQDEADIEDLVTTGQDVSLEMGMGFEIYFKYFKFAPEIRFSHGLNNAFRRENTIPELADAISSIKRKSITLYLNFQ